MPTPIVFEPIAPKTKAASSNVVEEAFIHFSLSAIPYPTPPPSNKEPDLRYFDIGL